MESKVGIQIYTVQPVSAQTSPISPYSLSNPTAIDAEFNHLTGILTVNLTFMIPGNMNANQVTVKQYYNSAQPGKLQFYLCYTSTSTATSKTVTCVFTASDIDASGNPISLSGILNAFFLVYNTSGPKSSRGVLTNIRITGTNKK